ncbi:hypothetical protein BGX27_002240 [Mortierella sp. AM989]|nr:hypothetical protein BGX27_002240 [Mortierella sp. AM989]
MDQLTFNFQQVQLKGKTSQSTGEVRSLEEATKADTLIRTLYSYAENKTQSATGRGRKLVSASKFELDLKKERNSSVNNNLRKSHSNSEIDKITVTSWKMNEFEYVKGTLPTLARGLFTYQDPTQKQRVTSHRKYSQEVSTNNDDNGIHRILIRGYDKFFNVGEVSKTKPEFIAEQTKGPYEVTLKENGCIIFMAGLPPHLVGPQGGCVVSSKHSLGILEPMEGVNQPEISHSSKGQEWLEKSLASKGKTLQEFGLWLWNNNLTAVAELCDDSFEEHILQYPAERAGLYLHGLNRNTADFQTLPSGKVQEAAKEWGLIQTDYVTFNTHQEVMDFAEKVRNAGEYDNRAVEGFVIRCKTKEEGSVFFFKIKYDEPYLMYREWREVTKHLWSVKVKKAAAKVPQDTVPKLRMKYPLTKVYVEFIKELMEKQPKLFVDYNKNQGIIAVRDMFLKEWESKSQQGQASLLDVSSDSADGSATTEEGFQRTVIMPIASIGCGKTTVSVALSKLFGWTHVNSDDFFHFRKNSGQKFITEVVKQLGNNTVVIADRNNFQYSHREKIMDAVLAEYPKTRFVAMYWSHDKLPIAQIREMAVERVKNRGSNHQCLTPEYSPDYEGIIQSFLRSFESLNPMILPDSRFNNVVEASVGEESLTFVKRIIEEFAIPILGVGGIGNHSIPKPDEVEEAVRYAIEDWKPQRVISGEAEQYHKVKEEREAKRVLGPSDQDISSTSVDSAPTNGTAVSRKLRKAKEPKYFAISLEPNAVSSFLDGLFEGKPKKSPEWIRLQETLKAWNVNHRIGPRQHVTVIHTSARKDISDKKAKRAEDLWNAYTDEVANASSVSALSTSSSPPSLPPVLPAPSPDHDNGEFTTVTKKKSGRGNRTQPTVASTASSLTSTNDVTSASPIPTGSAGSRGMESPELRSTIIVDYIIWSERVMALRVTSAKRTMSGKPYEFTNLALHVTVGTVGDHVKPFESNELLQQWSVKTKHGTSGSCNTADMEIFSIKLDTPKVFTGHLEARSF